MPASIDPLIQCTVATLDLTAYPGGKAFLAAYKAKYGVSNPDPYAIYGYEDMKLGLDTIAGLGAQGNSKSAVLKALFATKNRSSVLGTYGFDSNGDTTLKSYGLYKVKQRESGRSSRRSRRRRRCPDRAHVGSCARGAHRAPPSILDTARGLVEAGSLSPRASAGSARPLAALRRYIGRWGLIVALAALPIYYGIQRPDDRLPGRVRPRPRGDPPRPLPARASTSSRGSPTGRSGR